MKRAVIGELIASFLNEETVADAGICSPKRVAEFLNDYRADKEPTSLVRKDTLLNHLLCVHILHRQFLGNSALTGGGGSRGLSSTG